MSNYVFDKYISSVCRTNQVQNSNKAKTSVTGCIHMRGNGTGVHYRHGGVQDVLVVSVVALWPVEHARDLGSLPV